jgi:hypothetical protein
MLGLKLERGQYFALTGPHGDTAEVHHADVPESFGPSRVIRSRGGRYVGLVKRNGRLRGRGSGRGATNALFKLPDEWRVIRRPLSERQP